LTLLLQVLLILIRGNTQLSAANWGPMVPGGKEVHRAYQDQLDSFESCVATLLSNGWFDRKRKNKAILDSIGDDITPSAIAKIRKRFSKAA